MISLTHTLDDTAHKLTFDEIYNICRQNLKKGFIDTALFYSSLINMNLNDIIASTKTEQLPNITFAENWRATPDGNGGYKIKPEPDCCNETTGMIGLVGVVATCFCCTNCDICEVIGCICSCGTCD